MSDINKLFNSFISEIIRGFPEYNDRININEKTVKASWFIIRLG